MARFTDHERRVLARLAAAVIPAGTTLPGGGTETALRLERYVAALPTFASVPIRGAFVALDALAIATERRAFSQLDDAGALRVIDRWSHAPSGAMRHALRGLLTVLKAAHFEDAGVFSALACRYALEPAVEESPRWLARATDGREVTEDEELECDVVIVGSGAGGAALGFELAARGHAVVILEEGRYFRRHEFNGRAAEMTRTLYRDSGMTFALGNISVPVWAGRTVGGTTTINSGTCYRTPERTFRGWREQFGLGMFSSDSMDGYYARVESILGVAPADPAYLGGVARVVARGADALGWHHAPLRRNAPDCDGQGFCCFGCPTGAKRSADVSYIPMALERGASLYSSTRAERVLLGDRRAEGVVARTHGGASLTVRAKATVLAGGTLMTPVILLGQKLANASGMVGRNLSVHPAQKVMAEFDEPIEMHKGIPQGYGIEQFADEGLMFEGCSTPLEVTAMAVPFVGREFTRVMERHAHLAQFGFMIQDSSRGAVRRGPGGGPLITYSLDARDTRLMQRGVEILCELFLAAGARRIFPSVYGFDAMDSRSDLARLRAHRLAPGDFEVTAHHPLGTARMGIDPRTSVIGPDHQTHDVPDLYVVDGSAVPSSLGVNPQLTIMAMATRAAAILDRRLSAPTTVRPERAAEAMA